MLVILRIVFVTGQYISNVCLGNKLILSACRTDFLCTLRCTLFRLIYSPRFFQICVYWTIPLVGEQCAFSKFKCLITNQLNRCFVFMVSLCFSVGSGALEKEEEFIQRCMDSLVRASGHLHDNPESGLQVIQRGLILLTNHLESFRKRYAYHLRNWQQEGHGITSHQKSLQDKSCTPLRVVLQPAGANEKTTIEMLSSDLVAELRAEVARWWEQMQRQHQLRQQQQSSGQTDGQTGSTMLTPILGAMLGDGPIRMITQGQELTADVDEKTLAEMQFKDMQVQKYFWF